MEKRMKYVRQLAHVAMYCTIIAVSAGMAAEAQAGGLKRCQLPIEGADLYTCVGPTLGQYGGLYQFKDACDTVHSYGSMDYCQQMADAARDDWLMSCGC